MSVGCKRFCSLLVSKDYFKNIKLIMKNIRPISKNTSSACAPELRDGFKYSINKNFKLTYEQRRFYEDNGFLVINNLVDSELIEGCRKHFVDICEGRVSKGTMTLMKDISLAKLGATGENLYNKIQDILWDPLFEKYILYPKLLDYIESFIGPNIRAVHTMLINKPPDPKTLTSRHPLHQDLHYFPFRPENKIIAAWTAMEKITTENGCLVVIPGSHKGPLLEHDYPKWENGVNKAYHGVVGYDNYPTVPLHMEKGDTVFFHPLLIHGSGANFSKGYRKAISSHYAASDVYYIDVKGTKQENIAREIEGMAARRGLEMDFIEIWKLRGRHARGIDLHAQL